MKKNILSKRELVFLDVISSTINNQKLPNITLGEELCFCYDAQRADILPHVYKTIEKFSSEAWKEIAKKEAQNASQNYYSSFMITRNVLHILEQNGIEACVLKGIDLAEYFEVPEYRTFDDIDILIKDSKKTDTAIKALIQEGYKIDEGVHSPHHEVLVHSSGTYIELHTSVMRPFDKEKINRKILEIFSSDEYEFETRKMMGCNIKTLPEGRKAFYMLIHILEHFLTAGFGIRLLYDWTAFWNTAHSKECIDEYLSFVNDCGMKVFSDMITYLCVTFMGLSKKNAIMITGNIWERDDFHNDAMLLMKDILTTGRLGEDNSSSIVNATSPTPIGLFKEFHHQTRINFPKASKVFLLWPILWICSFVIFVRNNKKVRGVSTLSVLKHTKQRSELTKALHLW